MTTFIKITNKDIFNKLNEVFDKNEQDHREIIKHQLTTNGKVKLNRWIAGVGITLSCFVFGFVLKHLILQ